MLVVAFATVSYIMPHAEDLAGDDMLATMLGDVLDHVYESRLVYPGSGSVFSYTAQTDAGLLWGIQIADYRNGDIVQVEVSDGGANVIDAVRLDTHVAFKELDTRQWETYYFEVENIGDRATSVAMMFLDDPANADLSAPGSAFADIIIPLLASGILAITGMIVMAIGSVVSVLDWIRRNRF